MKKILIDIFNYSTSGFIKSGITFYWRIPGKHKSEHK